MLLLVRSGSKCKASRANADEQSQPSAISTTLLMYGPGMMSTASCALLGARANPAAAQLPARQDVAAAKHLTVQLRHSKPCRPGR